MMSRVRPLTALVLTPVLTGCAAAMPAVQPSMNGTRGWRRLGAATLLLLVSACGRNGLDGSATTLTIGEEGDERSTLEYGVARGLLFLPMLRYDETGELTGALAREWEVSADGREWRFTLRDDVRWHDGEPVTLGDIRFTIDLLQRPDVAGSFAGTTYEVVDESTIIVRNERPQGAANWTYEVFYPEHLLRDLDPRKFKNWTFWQRPVGNGPYRFARVVPKTALELEANAEHFRGRPPVDRVRVRFVGAAGPTELAAGRVDVLQHMDAQSILKVAGNPKVAVYHWLNPEIQMALTWRNDHPLFAEAAVRRALTLAINRPELVRVLNLPPDRPASDGVFTESQFRRGEVPGLLPYDPARAAALLDSAGWRVDDGDGIRKRNGVPFRFTITLPTIWDAVPAGVYIRDQLQRIGVDARLRPDPLARQRWRDRDYEAIIEVQAMKPEAITAALGPDGFVRYGNPRFHELLQRAQADRRAELLEPLYAELTEIFRAELPVTPLYPLASFTIADQRVRGLSSPWSITVADAVMRLSLSPDAP
jgi:peptide/nickel transport system substrate-binding protein